jgi:hypothetical protein
LNKKIVSIKAEIIMLQILYKGKTKKMVLRSTHRLHLRTPRTFGLHEYESKKDGEPEYVNP